MQNDKIPYEIFLRRLVIAPKGKQEQAISSAMALLDGEPPQDKLLYSGADAARTLSISIPTLYRLRASGAIKPVYIRGAPRYRREDLLKLAQVKA